MSISIRFVNLFNRPSAEPTYATHQPEPAAQTNGRRTLSRAQYIAKLDTEANQVYRKVWIYHAKRDYILYQCWFDEYAYLTDLIATVQSMSPSEFAAYRYEMRLTPEFNRPVVQLPLL